MPRSPANKQICELLEAYGDGGIPAEEADEHYAKIRTLLEAHLDAAKEVDDDKYTPLHWAAKNKAPLEVARMLLEAHPDAAKEVDQWKHTPLHLAAVFKAPLEVGSMGR